MVVILSWFQALGYNRGLKTRYQGLMLLEIRPLN